MKTLDQIAKLYKSQTLDGRDLSRLSMFVPYERAEEFGFDTSKITKEEWDKDLVPFTRENVLKQLKEDVEFGFIKALGQRGISASLMFGVVKMWNWILEEGLEDWPASNYAQYGLPLFKATAVKYGFENPIGTDCGDEAYYSSEWVE